MINLESFEEIDIKGAWYLVLVAGFWVRKPVSAGAVPIDIGMQSVLCIGM
jgi:hypothetical protein